MLGAIAGEIIGSYYEFHKIKTKEFELFHPESKFTDKKWLKGDTHLPYNSWLLVLTIP
jgi:hypothetical protein